MIIPKLLHGTGVMTFNAKEIGELQLQENAAYRRILDIRRNTPTSAMRGEIGSSLMVTRIMETKILFTRSILKGSNKLTKQVLNVSRKDENDSQKMGHKEMDRRYERKKKPQNIQSLKKEIKEDKYYDNRESSKYLFLARSNTLPLNIKRKYTGGDTKCKLCNTENEALVHFLINCKKLEHKRNRDNAKKPK